MLNLGGISYIDSGGLGTLVALYTTAQNAGGSVKLANLTQRVGDLLQVTKLLTVFEVYDSEEKALESFGRARPLSDVLCASGQISSAAPARALQSRGTLVSASCCQIGSRQHDL